MVFFFESANACKACNTADHCNKQTFFCAASWLCKNVCALLPVPKPCKLRNNRHRHISQRPKLILLPFVFLSVETATCRSGKGQSTNYRWSAVNLTYNCISNTKQLFFVLAKFWSGNEVQFGTP